MPQNEQDGRIGALTEQDAGSVKEWLLGGRHQNAVVDLRRKPALAHRRRGNNDDPLRLRPRRC
jgi:hypothetical protein